MRIAFVFSGLGAGGAEKIVNLLAHHRMAQGDTVHVLAVNADSPESYFPYDSAIKVEALGGSTPRIPRVAQAAQRLLKLRRRLRKLEPDLVISFLTKVNVLVGLATRGLNSPIIMSERNNFRSQETHPLWRLAQPVAVRGAASLVMQTSDAYQSLPERLRAKAQIIPNPVALPRDCVRIPGDGTRVVAVGRLEKQKGFDLLLEAFRHVAQSVPAAKLTIFGDGPQRGALERQARELGIDDNVEMPGITTSPVDWIGAGDIFVLSSRFEGFPNVLLEAMTAGLASIAFDCPWGPSEILSSPDTGLLVPAGNVEQLGEAIRSLLTDPVLRNKLATSGAIAASKRYATSSILEQWDDVIDKAV
ncbi:glycosyltransferase family 4 protein [Sinorhizobium numidicum]|uniref:Glycosyltransferase family 4 protein n=1 Tax=Sinorhizobium numidicum TaxID=680248 RepID=A0ABY8CSI1_9HYPH|nr:glycosyltransferase family 4 protein [Sinorhizobium numidicum]WEX75609.1 glycosyltransferase family 4 protein [Sinorhizobium numidicum]WEX81606.1 glycosyltransferase family 4 protein [Sinorhizobium numidicum]